MEAASPYRLSRVLLDGWGLRRRWPKYAGNQDHPVVDIRGSLCVLLSAHCAAHLSEIAVQAMYQSHTAVARIIQRTHSVVADRSHARHANVCRLLGIGQFAFEASNLRSQLGDPSCMHTIRAALAEFDETAWRVAPAQRVPMMTEAAA